MIPAQPTGAEPDIEQWPEGFAVMVRDPQAEHSISVTGDGAAMYVGCSCGGFRRLLLGASDNADAAGIWLVEHRYLV